MNGKFNAKSILGSDAFWMINKKLTFILKDIEATLMLSYLIDKEDYHRTRNELINIKGDQCFFATTAKIEEKTTIQYKRQKRCFKVLKSFGLIDIIVAGLPAKQHFTIKHDNICLLVTSSVADSAILEFPNGIDNILITELQEQNTNNRVNKGQRANSNELTVDAKNDIPSFDNTGVPLENLIDITKLSKEDIQDLVKNFEKKESEKSCAKKEKLAAKKKANQQAGIKAIELLNDLTGRKISTALTGRGSGNVDAVLKVYKKGYNFEEVELMIQYKCWEWGDNAKTKIWLRPSTLFGNKSTRYIEEAIEAKNNPAFQKMLKDAKNENEKGGIIKLGQSEAARKSAELLKNW